MPDLYASTGGKLQFAVGIVGCDVLGQPRYEQRTQVDLAAPNGLYAVGVCEIPFDMPLLAKTISNAGLGGGSAWAKVPC